MVMLALGGEKGIVAMDGFTLDRSAMSVPSSLRRSLLRFWKDGTRRAIDQRADLYLAGDLFTLPIASRAARATGARLMYDSRELYSALAALRTRPLTQAFWNYLEWKHGRNADGIVTVNQSIRELLEKKFPGRPVAVLHNYPEQTPAGRTDRLREALLIPASLRILLSQGGLQSGRGALQCIDILERLPDCALVFLGDGDLKTSLAAHAAMKGVSGRVYFHAAVPSDELPRYTSSADIGLCLIENLGKNNYFSLPNKLFAYISAGIPVVGSDMPEIARVINTNGIGAVADHDDIEGIANAVRKLLDDEYMYRKCAGNCVMLRDETSWDKEQAKLLDFVSGMAGMSC
jgi:glycosyltransferase involved in cell wall biosynthesis